MVQPKHILICQQSFHWRKYINLIHFAPLTISLKWENRANEKAPKNCFAKSDE